MRILKYLWFHFVMTATSWLPDLRPVLKLRGFLSRPAFKSCGANLQVAGGVTVNFTTRVELGRDVYLAQGCWLHAAGDITLEDGVQVGPYAALVSADHTEVDGSYRFGESAVAPIRICRGAWIAAHATVTKGIVVGRGALLGANSVATRDIPPFAKAGGVPARAIQKQARIEIVR